MKIWKVFQFLSALSCSFSLSAEPEAVPGEFLVKLKPNVSARILRLESFGSNIRTVLSKENLFVIKRPITERQSSALRSLERHPDVEYAEPNYLYRTASLSNDPQYGELWGLKNTGQTSSSGTVGTAGIDIGAEAAWGLTTGSKDILVAVIDTGIDLNHPDLKDNMWQNEMEANGQSGVDDDGNGFVDDVHGMNFSEEIPTTHISDSTGHGTHCAGTIGAVGNNGTGVVGVNWKVRIMPVQIFKGNAAATLEAGVKAIDYAVQMKAKVLSNSWTCAGCYSKAMQDAIARANASGAIFVAAAGNSAANNELTGTFPASYQLPNVVSVAALDNRGQMAWFSNFGSRTVHVAAPGVDVVSTDKDGTYSSRSGTSMATPHVAGVAALLASREPNLNGAELKKRLLTTARPLASLRGRVQSAGVVNAYHALMNTVPEPDLNDPFHWQARDIQISSNHAYKGGVTETYEITIEGAREISLFIKRFRLNNNKDAVSFYDRDGNLAGKMHGWQDGIYSPTVSGNYARIVLTSVNGSGGYGFDITQVAYR